MRRTCPDIIINGSTRAGLRVVLRNACSKASYSKEFTEADGLWWSEKHWKQGGWNALKAQPIDTCTILEFCHPAEAHHQKHPEFRTIVHRQCSPTITWLWNTKVSPRNPVWGARGSQSTGNVWAALSLKWQLANPSSILRGETSYLIKLSLVTQTSSFSSAKLESLLQDCSKKAQDGLGKGSEEIKKPLAREDKPDAIMKKEIKAPFVPVVESRVDASSFDVESTQCAIKSHQKGIQQWCKRNFGFSCQKKSPAREKAPVGMQVEDQKGHGDERRAS